MSRLSPALALSLPVRPVRSCCVRDGVTVPWEVAGYAEDYAALLRDGGVFDLGHWQTVSVRGPDARDFLHRLTTWDATRAADDRADRGAILTGRAHTIAMGWFLPAGDEVRLVFPGPQGSAAATHLEAMHFAERLTVTLEPVAVFATVAPGRKASPSPGARSGEAPRWQWDDDIQPLRWTLVPSAEVGAWLRARPEPLVGLRVFEYLRLDAGIPEVGRELARDAIFLEGHFERPIARNKGCYPGQEVIERIFTYGQVNRKLYPIAWDAVRDLPPGTPLRASVTEPSAKTLEAIVVAAEQHPVESGGIGLALFPRAAWEHPGPWTAVLPDGATVVVRRRA